MNHIESPVYSFLSDAADLILANFLCTLCCVPVLTIGASLAALDKVSLDIVLGNGGGILKKFFAAFRENFRHGTLLFWLWLIVTAGLFCYGVLIYAWFSGGMAQILRMVLAVAATAVFAVTGIVRSLFVRYRSTFGEHLHNALLVIRRRPITALLIALVQMSPLLLWYFQQGLFWRLLILWPLFGLGAVSWLSNTLMKPVLEAIESEAALDGV